MLAIHHATHPLGETSQYVPSNLWVFSHSIGYVGWIFSLLGLVGLYFLFIGNMGRVGMAGFVLTVVGGTTFYSGVLWIGAIAQPFLVSNVPALNDSFVSSTSSPALLPLLIGILLFVIGYPIFGFAVYRSKIMKSWTVFPAIMSVIGAVLFIGAAAVYVLSNIGGLVVGVSLATWGYALWSEKLLVTSMAQAER